MIMIISVLCMRAYLGVTKVFIIASLGTRGQHLGVGWLLMFPVTTSMVQCSSQQKNISNPTRVTALLIWSVMKLIYLISTKIKRQFFFFFVSWCWNVQCCFPYPSCPLPSHPSSNGLSRYLAVCPEDLWWMLNTLFSLLARVKTKWNKGSGVN